MPLFRRYLAPAGAPITGADLVAWAHAVAGRHSGGSALPEALRARFGDRHYFLSSTGRAGMTVLLRAMRRLAATDRDEVVVPSYTCYSVPASAIKAGLKVRLVDIDPATLDYAPDALARTDFRRVLAVVATNLYGLPNDLPAWAPLARANGAFLIDDAAQAMGASVGGRASGLWGDAGLFSFDKGKNVSAIDGGVVVTGSEPLAEALRLETATFGPPSRPSSLVHVVKALAYFVMLRPSLYGIATSLPGLGLGQTIFTTEFPLAGPDPRLSALAATMLPHLDEFTRARRANAHALLARIADLPTLTPVLARDQAIPAYLRLPVLASTESARNAAIVALNAAGIGATRSYPASLADVPELQPALVSHAHAMPGGRHVAQRIITLPTHPLVTPADVVRLGSLLEGLFSSGAPATLASVSTL